MRKVLILAYDFPPYFSVGGLRPYSWFKYLHEFGVYPIVVTRQWSIKHGNHLDYVEGGESNEIIIRESSNGTIIRTPYKPNIANRLLLKYGERKFRFLRKLFSAWFEFFQFVFLIGPKKELFFAANNYLKNNKVDVIIGTGDPFILFRYASKLGKKRKIPWIADYRDPWIQDKTRKKNFFHRQFDSYFERKIIKTARCVTTVSDFFKGLIESNVKRQRIEVIENGFDESFLSNGSNYPMIKKSKMIIAFAGTIYAWHPWQLFINSFSEFLEKRPDAKIELRFIGINIEKEAKLYLEKFQERLKSNVLFFNKLPSDELAIKLKDADALLLFNDYLIVGTKIYDYLALKKPILFCFKNDPVAIRLMEKHYHFSDMNSIHYDFSVQERILIETSGGIIIENSYHLLDVLESIYSEFEDLGYSKNSSKNIEQFSRKKQAEKLAGLINSLID